MPCWSTAIRSPISTWRQRTKHDASFGAPEGGVTRQQVIEELINEAFEVKLLQRFTISDIDKDVDNALSNMARRMRQSPEEFTDQLAGNKA